MGKQHESDLSSLSDAIGRMGDRRREDGTRGMELLRDVEQACPLSKEALDAYMLFGDLQNANNVLMTKGISEEVRDHWRKVLIGLRERINKAFV